MFLLMVNERDPATSEIERKRERERERKRERERRRHRKGKLYELVFDSD